MISRVRPGRLGSSRDVEALDVALPLQQRGQRLLELRRRHRHGVVHRDVGVADAGRACRRSGSVMVMCGLPSPARLGHAGHLAGVRQLAQADPAQPELAEHRVGPAAAVAAGVARTLNLGLRCCLIMSAFLAMACLLPLTLSANFGVAIRRSSSRRSPSTTTRRLARRDGPGRFRRRRRGWWRPSAIRHDDRERRSQRRIHAHGAVASDDHQP